MIEQILIFCLGLLTAAIVWLLLLPAFWRRAQRLVRRDLEAALPFSRNEIEAERDVLRAEHAVLVARGEQKIAAMQADVVKARAETGERLKLESSFLDRIGDGQRQIAALEVERDGLLARIHTLEGELDGMTQARDLGLTQIAGLEMQRDALTAKLNATIDLADSRRLALDDAIVQGERAREALEAESQRNAKLHTELQTVQIQLREAMRRAETLENDIALERIKRGDISVEASATLPVASEIPPGTKLQ